MEGLLGQCFYHEFLRYTPYLWEGGGEEWGGRGGEERGGGKGRIEIIRRRVRDNTLVVSEIGSLCLQLLNPISHTCMFAYNTIPYCVVKLKPANIFAHADSRQSAKLNSHQLFRLYSSHQCHARPPHIYDPYTSAKFSTVRNSPVNTRMTSGESNCCDALF